MRTGTASRLPPLSGPPVGVIPRTTASGGPVESRRTGCTGVAPPTARSVLPHPDEAREPRDAAVGQLLVAEGDGRADRRRVLPLPVAEPGPDRELLAAGQPDHQRPEPALVPALARLVADDHRLGVEE